MNKPYKLEVSGPLLLSELELRTLKSLPIFVKLSRELVGSTVNFIIYSNYTRL
jgi:hypothetical protein